MIALDTYPLLCGSVAGKVSKLGVALHDAGYKALGLDFKYIAVGTDNLEEAVKGFRALNFRGFGVSMPYKTEILSHLDVVADEVRGIGACNTVVRKDFKLHGFNTDWRGAMDALTEAEIKTPRSAVVVGSGGVARAIAYGLKSAGVGVWVASRNREAAEQLVSELRLAGAVTIEEQGSVNAELIVNATPISDSGTTPTRLELHKQAGALLDVAFTPKETGLVAEARRVGMKVAPGWRMLLHQAMHQFQLYTDRTPPITPMSKILEDALG